MKAGLRWNETVKKEAGVNLFQANIIQGYGSAVDGRCNKTVEGREGDGKQREKWSEKARGKGEQL